MSSSSWIHVKQQMKQHPFLLENYFRTRKLLSFILCMTEHTLRSLKLHLLLKVKAKSEDSSQRPPELLVKGWSLHPESSQSWKAIVFCRGNQILASESQHIYREDLKQKVGFKFRIPPPIFAHFDDLECFALYRSGQGYPFQRAHYLPEENKKIGQKRASQIQWQGKNYTISEQSLGFIDEIVFENNISLPQFIQLQSTFPNLLESTLRTVILKALFKSVMRNGNTEELLHLWPQYRSDHSAMPNDYLDLFESVSIHQAREHNKLDVLELAPPSQFSFQLPAVYPSSLSTPREWKTLPIPAEEIYHIRDAVVHYGSIVTKDQNYLMVDPSAAPQFDFIAGYEEVMLHTPELPEYCFLYGKKNQLLSLDKAILLEGRCSLNYFHWLIEYLPRLSSLSQFPELETLPLIIPAQLPATMLDALKRLAPNQPLFPNTFEDTLKIGELYVPSMMTFQPDTTQIPLHQKATFSRPHLEWVRKKILSEIAPAPEKHKRKILIIRPGTNRRSILNFQELTPVFLSHGFECIEPSTLTFEEQVRLFASASVIAGCAGAAFANLLFCQEGTQIISMVMEHNADHSMESNLAAIAGCSYVYLTGPSILPQIAYSNGQFYHHSSFWISVSKLRRLLKDLDL